MFTGNNIYLNAFESNDADALLEFLNHPFLIRRRYGPNKMPIDAPLSMPQIEATIEEWQKQEEGFALAVRLKEDDRLIGHCLASWGWDTFAPYIQLAIHPNHWRQGHGGETLNLLLDYLFNMLPANNVHGWVTALNTEGRAFTAKHGFKECGTYRDAGKWNGDYYDSFMVDILRKEWEAK